MNTKIFGFLVILLIISIVPVADAQISIGEKSNQRSVEVIINSDGNVHIKHVIASSNLPNQTELIYGTVSNISVTNEQGKEKQFSVIGGNIGVLIFPSNSDSIIEYDLEQLGFLKDKAEGEFDNLSGSLTGECVGAECCAKDMIFNTKKSICEPKPKGKNSTETFVSTMGAPY